MKNNRKGNAEPKTRRFDMRLSESEMAQLDDVAYAKRMTKSEFLVDCVKRAAKRLGLRSQP